MRGLGDGRGAGDASNCAGLCRCMLWWVGVVSMVLFMTGVNGEEERKTYVASPPKSTSQPYTPHY